MTASEKNTLFYIGIFGVLAYLAWKLWPALRKSLNESSTGGAVGSAGASSAAPYYPYGSGTGASNPLASLAGSLGMGGGSGSGKSSGLGPGDYGGSNESLGDALYNLIVHGQDASDQLALDSDTAVTDLTAGDTIPTVPLQNLDLNEYAQPLPIASSSGDGDSTDYSQYDANNYPGIGAPIDDGGDDGGGGDSGGGGVINGGGNY